MLYLRFMICLAVGLIGISLVLKTLMDVLFNDWDVEGDLQKAWQEMSKKSKRYTAPESARRRPTRLATRAPRQTTVATEFLGGTTSASPVSLAPPLPPAR